MFKFVIIAFILASCGATQQPVRISNLIHACHINGALPDSSCTPGAIFPSAIKDQICKPGYAASVRNVTQATKDKVYVEYGIANHPIGSYEIDHLIPLELGGSNGIKNLWPESYVGKYNAHMKDKVENQLRENICNNVMSLADAQKAISANWVSLL